MRYRAITVLFFALLFYNFSIFGYSNYRIVIQSGHNGSAETAEWHESDNSIVSSGKDGRIIVSQPGKNRILNRFKIADSEILQLRLNPVKSLLAAVIKKNDSALIQVWDWSTESLAFEYAAKLEPLFLAWSRKGSYLVIGGLGSQSVIILDGKNGWKLPYLKTLNSYYSYGYIGSTETILMTYNLSGAIRYWDIKSSALRLAAQTVSDLKDLAVLQNGKREVMFGWRDSSIYLINRKTGAVLQRTQIPGLSEISFDETNGELDALSNTPEGLTIHQYRILDNRFVFRQSNGRNSNHKVSIDNTDQPIKLLRRAGNSFLITGKGRLMVVSLGAVKPVINDRHRKIDSIAFHDSYLFVNSRNKILRFNSPFFRENSQGQIRSLSNLFRKEITTSSIAQETGITITEDGYLLHWDKTGSAFGNGIRKFHFDDLNERLLFPVSGLIRKVKSKDLENLLLVGRAGVVSIINAISGSNISSYTALGLTDAEYSRDFGFILAGFSSRGSDGTALRKIDTRTRKTTPITDNRFTVYSIESGPAGIYSMGLLKKPDGEIYTSLMWHETKRPERSWQIFEAPGERLDGILLPDPGSNAVFAAVENNISKIAGNNNRILYKWPILIRQLAVRGEILYGVDSDGTLILWDIRGGAPIMQVYFFDDGGWVALDTNRGNIWSTPQAISNVEIFRKDGATVDPKKIRSFLD